MPLTNADASPTLPDPKPSPASRRIARNSLLAALDTVVGFLFSLVGSILVARWLGPAKLGYYNFIVYVCSLTFRLASVGLPLATRKFLAEFLGRADSSSARLLWRFTSRRQSLMSFAAVTVGLLVVAWKVPPDHRLYAALAVASILPMMHTATFSAGNTAMEDFAANVLPSLISASVGFLGLLLALILHADLVGLAAALLLERTTDFLIRRRMFLRRAQAWLAQSRSASDSERSAQLRSLVGRFCTQALSLQALDLLVWDRSEMLFLKYFSPIRQVAFYSLAFNISQRLLLLPQSFFSAVGASVMVRVGQDPSAAARMTAASPVYLALLSLPLTFGVAALSPELIRLLYGSQYLPAIPVLTLLASFAAAKALMLPAQNLLVAENRQGTLLRVMSLTAGLNILLDLLWIPSHGALGAAWANCAAQTAACLGMWFVALRPHPVRPPWPPLLRIFLCASALAGLAGAVSLSLPGLPGLALAATVASVAYPLLLRLTRALKPADADRLLQLDALFPGFARPFYRRWVRFLVP